MDIPAQLIIVGIILIAIILIFSIGVNESIPAFVRNDFDNICDNYLSLLSANGGLSNTDKDNLKNEIEDLGYTNVTITAPSSAEWGSEVTLRVEAYYEYESIDADLSHKVKSYKSVYENNIRIFGIEN